jgi:periplasmic protein TonB
MSSRTRAPMPRPIFTVPPRYPFELRRAGITGEAVVDAVIDDDGRVTEVQVVRATHPRFGESAAASVRQWRYASGSGGMHLQVPVMFTLGE